jgi:hypothetical protein
METIEHKQPKITFTYQDAAMTKVIGEVMSSTVHRLCLWHISKNALSHLCDLKSD